MFLSAKSASGHPTLAVYEIRWCYSIPSEGEIDRMQKVSEILLKNSFDFNLGDPCQKADLLQRIASLSEVCGLGRHDSDTYEHVLSSAIDAVRNHAPRIQCGVYDSVGGQYAFPFYWHRKYRNPSRLWQYP
jgi:hypothetical protein